jgi:hypothetical protein
MTLVGTKNAYGILGAEFPRDVLSFGNEAATILSPKNGERAKAPPERAPHY